MKKILILIGFLYSINSFSQSTVPLRGDTIRVYKQGDTVTLKVEGEVMVTQYKAGSSNDSILTWNSTTKKFGMRNAADIGGGSGGSSFSFDSLSMISITSYPGVSVQWTTGTITSGSPTLTVASAKDFAIGQWVTVEGAGAAGVNLRTTITNVVGTTITLNNNAGTSVTNKRLRHDCTPGIQMALDDAVLNPKKSTLYIPADTATYVISGPLVTSVDGVNPNSQLYLPLVQASDHMVTVRILGSTPPNMASEGVAAVDRNTQGCIWESTLTTEASGTDPAVLGSSYYNAGVTGFKNYVNAVVENLIIRTATKNPAGTDIAGTMGGVHFRRLTQKYWNNLKIDISSRLVDRVYPVNATFGLYSPEVNNKVEIGNGKIFVEGYYSGHTPGEHEHTMHYIGGGNVHDIVISSGYYGISYVKYTGELNKVNILLSGSSDLGIVDYESEHNLSSFPFEADIKQLSGTTKVNIWRSRVSVQGLGPVDQFIASGNPDYSIDHGHGQNRFPARLVDGSSSVYPTDSLTGYWALDNETGNFPDSTGNGFDFTRVNGTTTVAGKIERAANFVAASSQTLTGSASNRLSAAAGLTVGGWFKIATGTTGTRALFSKWDAAGQAEWTIYWQSSNNKVHFAVSADGTNVLADVFSTDPDFVQADDTWHFILAQWDGTNITYFIDDETVCTPVAAASIKSNGSAAVGVGNYPYGAGSTFNGMADELFIYRKVLSTAEKTFLFNSGNGRHFYEGPDYYAIDTLSSTLVLNRLRLTSDSGVDSVIAYFNQIGELKKGMTFSQLRSSVTGSVDSAIYSTKAWRQKGDDSLGVIIGTKTTLAAVKALGKSKGFFLETPGAAEAVDMWQTPVAITVSSLKAILRGSTPSVTYNIKFGTDITSATSVFTSDITCTSVTTGCSNSSGFNDATIPAGSFIWIVTTAASGTITSIGFTLNYTED